MENFRCKGFIAATGKTRPRVFRSCSPGKIEVSEEKLELRSLVGLGSWSFSPQEVVGFSEVTPDWLESYGLTLGTLLTRGKLMEIKHSVGEYPRRLIFISDMNFEDVVENIGKAGFLPIGERCLKCLAQIGPDISRCPKCGWSWLEA